MEKIVYLPLDERPCNYSYPAELAEMTDLTMTVPPLSILGVKNQPADLEALSEWLERETADASVLILSLDMYVYGGIVPSRLHSYTQEECMRRLEQVKKLKSVNPQLKIHAFNLIMRVPAYDSADEEPAYYAEHGRKLFEYGWLLDKSEREELAAEERDAFKLLQELIPAEVLKDFTGRRRENAQVNQMAVELAANGVIDKLIIPLDDNSQYGFSAKEQRELLYLVEERNLMDRVMIYPGADEIGCTLLAGVFCEIKHYAPEAYIRYSSTRGPFIIPKYEDRSLNESIKSHMTAAGVFIGETSDKADFVLMVNCPPSGQAEMAESSQLYSERSRTYYSEVQLAEFARAIGVYSRKGAFVALADVAVCNGADHTLMKLLAKTDRLGCLDAYGGWNTSGNTLGTVIAHSVIASYYRTGNEEAVELWREKSRTFLIHRLVEDWGYQTLVRTDINQNILPNLGVTTIDLGDKEEEIISLIERKLNAFCRDYLQHFTDENQPVIHTRLPWHRMFEVDFELKGSVTGYA